MKAPAFQALQDLYIQDNKARYPDFPEAFIPKRKYSDKDSNGLTRCIIDFLNFKGHYAVRINTQGQFRPELKKWVKGSTAVGTADIHSVIKGRHVSIEVKIGRDIQSKDQEKTQKRIETAGGVYLLTKTFDEFYNWYRIHMCQNSECA